jgi:hypothetical protein
MLSKTMRRFLVSTLCLLVFGVFALGFYMTKKEADSILNSLNTVFHSSSSHYDNSVKHADSFDYSFAYPYDNSADNMKHVTLTNFKEKNTFLCTTVLKYLNNSFNVTDKVINLRGDDVSVILVLSNKADNDPSDNSSHSLDHIQDKPMSKFKTFEHFEKVCKLTKPLESISVSFE